MCFDPAESKLGFLANPVEGVLAGESSFRVGWLVHERSQG